MKLNNNTVTIKGSGHEIILDQTSFSVTGSAVLNLGADGYDGSLSIKSVDDTRTIHDCINWASVSGEVVNNHAANAGDDVFYYGDGGTLNIGCVPDGMTLDDCGYGIDGWYVDGALEGKDTSRWNETETEGTPVYFKKYGIPKDGSDITEQLALKAAHAVYEYTIEYYIDGTLYETLTEHGTSVAGTLKDEEIPDKCPEGYKFDKREDVEVTEPDADGKGGPGSFTVKIYYIEDKTPTEPTVPPIHYYIVKWNNYDNTNLETDYCTYYQLPTYDGATPVKPADDKYTYEFIGWDKELVRVTGDTVYTAQFKAVEKEQPQPEESEEPENPDEPDKPLPGDKNVANDTTNTGTDVPKTGDAAADALALNLMLLSISAMAGAVLCIRRKITKK